MKEKVMLEKTVSIKITKAEYDLLKKKAEEDERPLGQLMRRAIRKFIKADIGSSN